RLSVNFVSQSAALGIPNGAHLQRRPVPIRDVRSTFKDALVHNTASPEVKVDPESLDVTIDGELVAYQPAEKLPLAHRYFLVSGTRSALTRLVGSRPPANCREDSRARDA